MKPRFWAVVPAAGVGARMHATRPKQYLMLHDKTILEATLERLLACQRFEKVLVAMGAEDEQWPALELSRHPRVETVIGGVERCHSVLNCLQVLNGRAHADDWVAVHDAVRPCVRLADIENLCEQLQDHRVGGLLAVPVNDTLKRAGADRTVASTVDRQQLWHAQTPQMFRFGLLQGALEAALKEPAAITDDASAVEQAGYAPLLVAGHRDNIKITHAEDLALARLIAQSQANEEEAN